MKRFNLIRILLSSAFLYTASFSFTACNFLDVVPPEQITLDDAVSNATETEKFLYSCYSYIENPLEYHTALSSADEYGIPSEWGGSPLDIAWDLFSPANSNEQRWNSYYHGIGQCYRFLEKLPEAIGVSDNLKKQWAAEAEFMIAYYHFEVLRLYGPCPITDKYLPQDTPNEQFPGRSHYDAVTEFIVNLLDKVVNEGNLPTNRDVNERGRATSVIAKALKARVLVYAASPLWNGSFPYTNWQNKVESSYNGKNYGKELVSKTYDAQKWERAAEACIEAINAAKAAGHKLCDLSSFSSIITDNMIQQVYAPTNGSSDTNADEEFRKWVIFYRFLLTAQVDEGNTELIWGLSKDSNENIDYCSMPYYVVQRNNGTWVHGYQGYAPFLGTMERFYTKDGKFYDNTNPNELQRWTGAPSDRPDLTNLVVDREPRFYAWMAFDQGNWGTLVSNGKAVKLEFKKKGEGYQGLDRSESFKRNYTITGFLNQKFIRPDRLIGQTEGSDNNRKFQRPLIRMAELYLNLAECYAMLNRTTEALNELNEVHTRAGLPQVTETDISSDHPLIEWVRNERAVEFVGEGQRFFDVRRWCQGEKYMAAGVRQGLNNTKENPKFEEFNQRTIVNQPYKWTERMYILPVFQSEIGKNQQLVQAPGY